jgi:alpha-L-fucosidase 2
MEYEIQAKCSTNGQMTCSSTTTGNSTIIITNATSITCVLAGETEYNIDAGTAADNYSFAGNPYHEKVSEIMANTTADYYTLWDSHSTDHWNLYGAFALDLGARDDLTMTTQDRIDAYTIATGDVVLDQLM